MKIIPGILDDYSRYTDRGIAELLLEIEKVFDKNLNIAESNRILREANLRCGREYKDTQECMFLAIRAGILRRLYYESCICYK